MRYHPYFNWCLHLICVLGNNYWNLGILKPAATMEIFSVIMVTASQWLRDVTIGTSAVMEVTKEVAQVIYLNYVLFSFQLSLFFF